MDPDRYPRFSTESANALKEQLGQLTAKRPELARLVIAYVVDAQRARQLIDVDSARQDEPHLGVRPRVRPERDWFKILEDFAMAEFLAGDPEEYPPIRWCPQIERDYERAARCVEQFINTPPQNEAEWDEFQKCLSDLQRYAAEMEANDC